MQHGSFGKLGVKPSLLGFGTMRLPILDGDSGKIDYPKATEMLRSAIDRGVNYVDTAWPYHKGESENFVGHALQDGYREKVYLATKNPTWMIEKPEDFDEILDKQLEKLKTDHIDFYLQHAVDSDTWPTVKKFKLWERAQRAKEQGKIKYYGFSFHDEKEVFFDMLDTYDWDFCQIQFNYLDTNYQAGLEGLMKAASKGLGVIVMEPLRGGRLANGLPAAVHQLFKEYPDKREPYEWAFRFVANFPQVATILSGMSTPEQVDANLKLFNSPDMKPGSLSEKDLALLSAAQKVWSENVLVNCTGCEYCMPCPQGVSIPTAFSIYNFHGSVDVDALRKSKKDYAELVTGGGDPSKCIECGACESVCPQHIAIPSVMKEIRKAFGQ